MFIYTIYLKSAAKCHYCGRDRQQCVTYPVSHQFSLYWMMLLLKLPVSKYFINTLLNKSVNNGDNYCGSTDSQHWQTYKMIFLINSQEKIWYNKWTTLEKSSIPHPNHTFTTWKLCANTRNWWLRGRKAESQLNQCWIHSLWDWAGSEVIKFKMLVDASGIKNQKSKECIVRWFPPGMEDTAPWLAEMHILYNGAAVAVGVTGCDWSSTVDCRSQWQQRWLDTHTNPHTLQTVMQGPPHGGSVVTN